MTDPIIAAARFLEGHLDWLRHRSATEIQECFADIAAAARVVTSLARGPAEQRYLGPCGAPLGPNNCPCGTKRMCLSMLEGFARCDEGECVHSDIQTCDGDVYGRAGAATGTCRTCGAQVDQAERRAWLDQVARDWLYTAADIADAYGINVKTIRSWHNRGRLPAHGEDAHGTPLHKVGDVLDLAAEAAARRETGRAERERRTERMGA